MSYNVSLAQYQSMLRGEPPQNLVSGPRKSTTYLSSAQTNTKEDPAQPDVSDKLNLVVDTKRNGVDPKAVDPSRVYEYIDVTEIKLLGDRTHRTTTSVLARKRTDKVEQFTEYSLMLLRIHDAQHKEVDRSLHCNSVSLQKAVREIVKISNSCNLFASPIVLKPPYQDLFFHREAFANASQSTARNDKASGELGLLRDFIFEDHLKDTISEYDALTGARKINYKLLWCLFPPAQLCVIHLGEQIVEGAIVETTTYDRDEQEFIVHYMQTAYDGYSWGISKNHIKIKFYTETVDISNLNIVPIHFYTDTNIDIFKADLVERGRQYESYVTRPSSELHWHYTGRFVTLDKDAHDVQYNDRVILDRQTCWEVYKHQRLKLDWKPRQIDLEECQRTNTSLFIRYLSGSRNPEGVPPEDENESDESKRIRRLRHEVAFGWASDNDSDDDLDNQLRKSRLRRHYNSTDRKTKGLQPHSTFTLTKLNAEDEYFCCPSQIESFALKSKDWGWVRVDGLQKIEWNESQFENLQMKPSTKHLLKVLTSPATSNLPAHREIDNKGIGLVVLLHGNPGMGKTLTAESIAEMSHRPLYSVTSGELSEYVTEVEKNLALAIHLAEKWNAVLLIDEADVFMFKRHSNDYREAYRNAMVTIFLKQIEYYHGLLFLTTNQVEDFDPAFDSRIHLKIHYPNLDSDRRTSIWRKNLSVVQVDDSFTETALAKLASLDLNGREIKNVTRTAERYAIASGTGKVTLEQVNLVLSVNRASKAFINRGVEQENSRKEEGSEDSSS